MTMASGRQGDMEDRPSMLMSRVEASRPSPAAGGPIRPFGGPPIGGAPFAGGRCGSSLCGGGALCGATPVPDLLLALGRAGGRLGGGALPGGRSNGVREGGPAAWGQSETERRAGGGGARRGGDRSPGERRATAAGGRPEDRA